MKKEKEKMKKMKKKFTLLELVLFLAIIAILAAIILPAMDRGPSRERARRISCASNLKCVGLALKQYSMDFSDIFPHQNNDKGLDMLRQNDYCSDYKIYTCPSTTDTGQNADGTINSSYIYHGGLSEEDPADSSIMRDKTKGESTNTGTGNHDYYGNILFLDGHVTGFAGAKWVAKPPRAN